MFLADHDLQQLFVILLASGTAGVLVAISLGRRVLEASRSLGEATRRIGEGQVPSELERPSTAELAALATELETMSRRLDEARERERALDASRRELVAWVSHDLRTPLAGIRAMAEALEDGVVTDRETVARYHRTLRMEADRLAQLVDDLFELSIIQAGALHLEMERASLGDMVSDALAGASVLAETKGVRLEGRIDGAAPEIVLSTPGMSRVLRNLLENAIRLTPADGTVWVETGVVEDLAFVAVADQCGGIPETDLSRLFDPAFRGEVARTPRSDGSPGLGLAIARGIVEAHRGDISVRNEGRGCRFTVRLPLLTARVKG
jgi:signal transduction histidine kinase